VTGTKSWTSRLLIVLLQLGMLVAVVVAITTSGQRSTSGTRTPPSHVVRRPAVPAAPRGLLPDVTSRRASDAQAALRRAGFRVQSRRARSATVAAGLVASTSPPPFAIVARGDRVTVVISAGPPASTVPQVSGAQISAAQRRLRHAGLGVTVVTRQSRERAGTVLGETPPAGAHVRRATVVRLTIAAPIPKVAVPRVMRKHARHVRKPKPGMLHVHSGAQ